MSTDEFTKLYKHLDGKFKAVDDRYDRTDAKINIYVNAVGLELKA